MRTVLILLVMLLLLSACQQDLLIQEAPRSQKVVVKVEKPKFTTINQQFRLLGSLIPAKRTPVLIPPMASISKQLVEPGTLVQAKQPLLQLDVRNLQEQRIHLMHAIAKIDQWNSNSADFTKAQEADENGHWVEFLAKLVDKTILEPTQQMQREQQRWQLEEQLKTIEQQIKVSIITSPVAGQYLQISHPQIPDQTMHYIVSNDQIIGRLWAFDHQIPYLRQGQVVQLSTDGKKQMTGHISKISSNKDLHTQAYAIEITPTQIPSHWRWDQQVVGEVFYAHYQDRLTIPRHAIWYEENDAYLFRVVDDKAVKTKVILGAADEKVVEVQSGLQKDDLIIVDGVELCSHLIPVQIVPLR
ncbi:efflux RND transporter periplasmic adaptor subunit [Rubeoparvulum massiliense]|uniref:efflux RND transporter periplasmic adaptor subunit n=1 Tax=Rubeoparvulum massiliense TaxID=1631346 RepID=UPI00065E59F6|nr:HlyD family efflux transporter periplasmic adaptor subunit [Rubeoparvulum massiliense]